MTRKALLAVAVLGFAAALGWGWSQTLAHDGEAAATIVVEVAQDAKVYVDGRATQQVGTERTFVTPPLPPGREFHYDLKVELACNGRTASKIERIAVRAGRTTRVDLTAVGDETAAAGGYLYTINNDPRHNGIAVLARAADGSLKEVAGSPV